LTNSHICLMIRARLLSETKNRSKRTCSKIGVTGTEKLVLCLVMDIYELKFLQLIWFLLSVNRTNWESSAKLDIYSLADCNPRYICHPSTLSLPAYLLQLLCSPPSFDPSTIVATDSSLSSPTMVAACHTSSFLSCLTPLLPDP
jgi:hypothetical protein